MPPSLIGHLIGSLIGAQIGSAGEVAGDITAAETAKPPLDAHPQPITWESLDTQETRNPPPTPSPTTTPDGGGEAERADQEEPRWRGRRRVSEPPAIPDTESAQLLHTINVLPEQLIELAEIPVETVRAAIDDGRSRPGIRDLAGWVVTLLRTHRDHGWTITPPPAPADSPDALRMAFARYAVEQEAACRAGLPDNQPWFPAPDPVPLHTSGAMIQLWNQVQSALKTQLARNEFNTWIRRATLTSIEQGVATIMVPTALAQQVTLKRYSGMLRDLLRMYVGEALELRVILNPHALEQTVPETAPSVAAAAPPAEPAPSPQSPAWIAADRWIALPVMLRAALAGSELIDGVVQGRSPFLSGLLKTRHAREIERLVAAAQSFA